MKGELIENRVIVWNIEDSRKLFSQGYYGKPIGIPKPKIEEIDAPLILDFIESLYLLENKKITISKLKQKLLFYKDYGKATIETIFSKEQLKSAIILNINTVKSTLFININNTFLAQELPNEIQYSNVEAIDAYDIDNDGNLDLIFGGNQYLIKPQFGRQDASQGWLVYGENDSVFKNVRSLNIKGQIRDFDINKINSKTYLITTINNDTLRFYEIPNFK